MKAPLYLFISLWIRHQGFADTAGQFEARHGSLLVVSFGVALLESGRIRK